MVQLDPLKLVGYVAELDVNRVSMGAPVGARLATGDQVQGRITFIGRAADPVTRTFRVEAQVANPDLAIRDGQTAEILIQSAGRTAHLLPQSALTLNDAGLGIPYLNVDYDFGQNSVVRLFNQTFDFQNIRLTDRAEGTTAVLDGTISHQFFSDWRLNLDVDTQGERFLLLNTEYDEEELYYGTAFAEGTGRIFGPTNALNINFEGSTARGTSLKIPISDVASLGDYSFINFIEKDERRTIEAQPDESLRVVKSWLAEER